jgi:hypothetical protein
VNDIEPEKITVDFSLELATKATEAIPSFDFEYEFESMKQYD